MFPLVSEATARETVSVSITLYSMVSFKWGPDVSCQLWLCSSREQEWIMLIPKVEWGAPLDLAGRWCLSECALQVQSTQGVC